MHNVINSTRGVLNPTARATFLHPLFFGPDEQILRPESRSSRTQGKEIWRQHSITCGRQRRARVQPASWARTRFPTLSDVTTFSLAGGIIQSLRRAHLVLDDAWEMRAWSPFFSTKAYAKHRILRHNCRTYLEMSRLKYVLTPWQINGLQDLPVREPMLPAHEVCYGNCSEA